MTQRTALLGLEKLFKKPKAPAAPATTPTSKPDRFSVPMKDVVKGAYFYVRAKEIPAYDLAGQPYPEKVKGNSHVEVTGRKNEEEGLVEVLYKRSRVWVRLSDLSKPLQSKFTGASVRTATGGARDIWDRSTNIADLLNVLTETADAKKLELKLTPKVRKAIVAAVSAVLESVADWTVTIDGSTMPVADGVAELVGGINQAESFRILREAIRDRVSWTPRFENPNTKQKGSTRTVDYFLAAAVLMAATNKGSTHGRAAFLKEVLPQALYRAGGSQLQATVAKAFRTAIPWSDVEKLRKSRKLKTATVTASGAATPETPRTEDDVRVMQSYIKPERASGPNDPQDLIIAQLLRLGPVKEWDLGGLKNPRYMAMILTAVPNDMDAPYCLEQSKQLGTMVTLLEEEILRRVDFSRLFQASGAGDKKTLSEIYDAAKAGGPRDVSRLMRLCNTSSWYNLVMDDQGRLLQNMHPVRVLNALLALYMAYHDSDSAMRGQWLNAAVRLLVLDKVLSEHVIAHKIRSAFKWSAVLRMLAHRTKLA